MILHCYNTTINLLLRKVKKIVIDTLTIIKQSLVRNNDNTTNIFRLYNNIEDDIALLIKTIWFSIDSIVYHIPYT